MERFVPGNKIQVIEATVLPTVSLLNTSLKDAFVYVPLTAINNLLSDYLFSYWFLPALL